MVEYYEEQGKVKRISAVPPPDEVFLEVEKALDGLKVKLRLSFHAAPVRILNQETLGNPCQVRCQAAACLPLPQLHALHHEMHDHSLAAF